MELMTPPASPPPQDLRFDSAATSPYATAPSSPRRLAGVGGAAAATNPFVEDRFLTTTATAPASPSTLDFPIATTRLSSANPFNLFQHFVSAPASPTRAAAIYARFNNLEGNGGNGEDDYEYDDDFQPRASYSAATSAVPFDWEEKPGTPKPGFAEGNATTAANGTLDLAEFEFGTFFDRSAPPPELTTADELFHKGKIRPLKPPPKLHDGGSVGSSPRSPKAKAGMWSPRRRSRVGSGTDFDPFAAAFVEATKAPSPLGGKEANGIRSSLLPKKPDPVTTPPATPPASRSGGKKKWWRLSDLLLFRSSSEGRVPSDSSKEPIFKCSPTHHPDVLVKKAGVESATANGNGSGKQEKQSKKAGATADGGMSAPHRQSITGCVRLNPGLQRLAKGFNGYSSYFGRGMAGSGPKG